MKILFLGCHCDDIELGCGGTIHKFSDRHDMLCVTLSIESVIKGQPLSLQQQSEKALSHLGVKNLEYHDFVCNDFHKDRQLLWELLNRLDKAYKPDVVFTQEQDFHQDHETLFLESIRNFRKATILSYKASLRNSPNMSFNYYEALNKCDVLAKQKAISKYRFVQDGKETSFDSQLDYCKPLNIEAISRMAGISIEEEFAEGFNIIKGTGLL